MFTERVEGIPSYLRQTHRLAEIVRVVGYAAGGLPGARLLSRLAIRTSDDTVLRRVKCLASSDSTHSLEVLGVDDWAWRKGQAYGTILVDLERRLVSDLLPDRSTKSFQAWLHQQPRVRLISRDRGGIYAEGAQLGAPSAQQVADRFHLFVNLSTAIERALQPCHHQLLLATPTPPPAEAVGSREVRRTRQQAWQQERRQCRRERYEKMVQLHCQGCSQKKISEVLRLDRRTVRRWMRAGVFPARQARRTGPNKVHRFEAYSNSAGLKDATMRHGCSRNCAGKAIREGLVHLWGIFQLSKLLHCLKSFLNSPQVLSSYCFERLLALLSEHKTTNLLRNTCPLVGSTPLLLRELDFTARMFSP